jgi:hypothetical protein
MRKFRTPAAFAAIGKLAASTPMSDQDARELRKVLGNIKKDFRAIADIDPVFIPLIDRLIANAAIVGTYALRSETNG